MFSRHLHTTENVHGRIHIIFRLNQEIDHAEKDLTKGTLCGIVLFKLNPFFSHVFAGT